MKCTKCGKNIAVYHYVTDLNGQVSELHLCEDCARKAREENGESPWETMDRRFREELGQLYGEDSWMGRFLEDGFGGERWSLPDGFIDINSMTMPRLGALMLPGFFLPAPRRTRREEESRGKETAVEKEGLGEKLREKKREVDEVISKKREILALREEMHRAARNEEYERAAQLRDRLRALENSGNA